MVAAVRFLWVFAIGGCGNSGQKASPALLDSGQADGRSDGLSGDTGSKADPRAAIRKAESAVSRRPPDLPAPMPERTAVTAKNRNGSAVSRIRSVCPAATADRPSSVPPDTRAKNRAAFTRATAAPSQANVAIASPACPAPTANSGAWQSRTAVWPVWRPAACAQRRATAARG